MNINSALQKLFSLHQFGVKLGLDNIIKLLDEIGNPQNQLKTFHIAGSNGKGSAASFLDSILHEFGFKVGLYTSPHFVRFNERIRVNGIEIPDEFVLKFMSGLDEYIAREEPTFFELTTAMAFLYFAEMKVDYAIIETGLGGRLDATNVLQPLASIITSISFEHTTILGDSLTQIAGEKAAIIKPNSNSFVGALPKEAIDVIKVKAENENADFFNLEEIITDGADFVALPLGNKNLNIYQTPLAGKHQLLNAALAALSIWKTLRLNDANKYLTGIKNVVGNSGIQGRFERFSDKPSVIFDAAHNPEGIKSFVQAFKNERKKYSRATLIFGAKNDKSVSAMLKQLEPLFDQIFVISTGFERAYTVEELIKKAEIAGVSVQPLEKPIEYIREFISVESSENLTILGSIYMLGDLKMKLNE